MPDTCKHRGPHPDDERLFAPEIVPVLRAAADDLCWLLDRGYATASSLKLVGDRYDLRQRQRIAIGRCVCTSKAAEERRQRSVAPECLRGEELWIDGYNILTTLEAALGGGAVLVARDGCYRDMASMHGSYRKVAETIPALRLIGEMTAAWQVAGLRWFLDKPVSNSARLKTILRAFAQEQGWNWHVELSQNPDQLLSQAPQIVATADSVILDRCARWLNLARIVVEERVPDAWLVDLSVPSRPQT